MTTALLEAVAFCQGAHSAAELRSWELAPAYFAAPPCVQRFAAGEVARALALRPRGRWLDFSRVLVGPVDDGGPPPPPLEQIHRERRAALDEVVARRARALALQGERSGPVAGLGGGRLLLCPVDDDPWPPGQLFDHEGLPPWATWVDYRVRGEVGLLLSYIPPRLLAAARLAK